MKKRIKFILIAAAALLCCLVVNAQEMSAIDAIMTRVSVRSYLDKPVEAEKIDKLLRAAMAAPSAKNRQPWAFVVVTDKEVLAALSKTNPYGGMIAKAPLAIIVCGDLEKALTGQRDLWVHDCSAASENILLAANAPGLGSVWTASYPNEDRVIGVREALGLPSTIVPLNIIAIGYPSGINKPKDKYKPENIHYNTW